MNNIFFL